jgi:hypothetical protein
MVDSRWSDEWLSRIDGTDTSWTNITTDHSLKLECTDAAGSSPSSDAEWRHRMPKALNRPGARPNPTGGPWEDVPGRSQQEAAFATGEPV